MQDGQRSVTLLIGGSTLLLTGLALGAGGLWLLFLGGTWYYVIAAASFLLTGVLLLRRRRAALPVYAVIVIGTLIWALWEAGLDWWPLAARGGVIFLIGVLLLTPWITRRLTSRGSRSGEHPP